MVVSNGDREATSGDAAIPAQGTVLFIFNGDQFVSVDSLRSQMKNLTGITELKAAKDLQIGNFSFEAASFKFSSDSSIPKSAVLFHNSLGAIAGSTKFSFVRGVLSTTSLSVESIVSDVDVKYNIIK